ncbi:MAG: DUF1176 domain-containing protein [Rhizobiaceae bacterium]
MRSALAVSALLLATAPAPAGPSGSFRDFTAYCTNAQTCTVEVMGQGEGVFGAGLKRAAGPGAAVEGLIRASAAFRPGSTVAFTVDGAAVATVDAAAFRRDEDWNLSLLAGSPAVDKLMAAFRAGRRLSIAYDIGKGIERAEFPLNGYVAALIFVDEAQGRIGARDALEKKGAAEPVDPGLREIASIDALPAALRDRFTGDGECAFFDPLRFGYGEAFEARLDGENSLVIAPCAEGGAYNQPYLAFHVSGANARAIPLPGMGEKGPVVRAEAWNVSWDNRKGELTAFMKGRGLGDCGLYDRWTLINAPYDPGFMLLESRAKDECDGNFDTGPEGWPRLWPPER